MANKERYIPLIPGLLLLVGVLIYVCFTPAHVPVGQDLFTIGIYEGDSPWNFRPLPGLAQPILTAEDIPDTRVRYVADPFMVHQGSQWYLFFEAMNAKRHKGQIALIVSRDLRHWHYQGMVLVEPFHLSYPYVFKWRGVYYMIPESFEDKTIRLYRAQKFPTQWTFVKDLVHGPYADTSIFRYRGKWWISTVNPRGNYRMYLFYADQLAGPWHPHALNPVIKHNAHFARCGGRIISDGGKLYRYAQDDYKLYGNKLWAFQITDLTTTSYAERLTPHNPILTASGQGWNKEGMHTVDPHRIGKKRWIACVDGRRWRW